MARKPGKQLVAQAPAKAVKARPVLDINESTANYCVNFAEVSYTVHEFSIQAVRMPTKLSDERLEAARKSGVAKFTAEVQLVLPPTLLPGLIRALTISKENYEKQFGVAIADVGA